jgi:cytochrome c oxidase subunit 2
LSESSLGFYEVTKLFRYSSQTKLIILISILLTLFLSGCATNLPQSTLYPAGDVADGQKDLFMLVFWIAAIIFVIVEALLVYIIIRFRQKKGQEDYLPKATHGNTMLEIGWTILPVLIVIGITIPTIQGIAETYDPPKEFANTETITVEVVGAQWWWEYRYLDANGDVDFVTANEMHIPTNTVVKLKLKSVDVIHSFSVPRLAGTRDVIPGRDNRMWFNATEEGIFMGQCKEFCGASHALMRTIVIAESPDNYTQWAESQRLGVPNSYEQTAGWKLFQDKGCVGCHTIRGTTAIGDIGPDLTHFGSRHSIASNVLHKGEPSVNFVDFYNDLERDDNLENLKSWLENPPAVKPGSLMPDLGLTDSEITTLAEFLENLQ